MIYIASVEQAKEYLGLTWAAGDPREALLLAQIATAEGVISDYLKVPADEPTKYAAHVIVQGAALRQLADQWRWRGDDAETVTDSALDKATDGYLSPLVTSMLHRLRDPALA